MKILAAQINPIVGDLKGNFEKVASIILKNSFQDIIVFPELTLIGYPPNDLLLRKGFVEEQQDYLEQIRSLTLMNPNLHIVIGGVCRNERVGKPFHNTAFVYRDGQEILRYHKQLLPTYNVFDENRYFEAGHNEQTNFFYLDQTLIGILICEDCWNNEAITKAPLYSTDPVHTLTNGAGDLSLVITLNASPSHVGKNFERYEMYKTLSKRCGPAFLYVNQVGAQDDLVFDGHSFYVNGDFIEFASGYIEENFYIEINENKKQNLPLKVPQRNYWYNMMEHLKLGLKDYCAKTGFKSVVVGSSGGIDSALVLAIAKEALGAENVFAVTMPSKYSSSGSVDDSVTLCNNLGISLFARPIKEDVTVSIESFEDSFAALPSRLTIENMQARIRGRILMEFSNHFGAMVLSTGNKSESSVGYCTLYGDTNGGLALISDLYKMEVYGLAKFYNEQKGDNVIPKNIIDKAPSAELWEGQKDEDSLPPYPILDAVLKLYLENDYLSNDEREQLVDKISVMSINDIKRILNMVDKAEFKRKQCPPTIRVHNRAWGFGRNLPIAKKVKHSILNLI